MKPRFDRSKFMKRTYSMFAGHKIKLNEAAFGKDKTLWPETRLELPFALDYLRMQVESACLDLKPCAFCGDTLKLSNVSLDHCIPQTRREEFRSVLDPFTPTDGERVMKVTRLVKRRGTSPMLDTILVDVGLLVAAYSWANLALCCERCNRRKGELTSFEYKPLLELVNSFPEAARKYVLRKLAQKPPFFRVDKKQESAA